MKLRPSKKDLHQQPRDKTGEFRQKIQNEDGNARQAARLSKSLQRGLLLIKEETADKLKEKQPEEAESTKDALEYGEADDPKLSYSTTLRDYEKMAMEM